MFLRAAVISSLSLLASGCTPPCVAITTPAPLQQVCHRADAGAIAPDSPFVLEGTTGLQSGSCRVAIDGGQLDLFVDGTASCADGTSGAFAERAAPAPVRCVIPGLPAGTYDVNSSPALTFTIPDAGVAPCQ